MCYSKFSNLTISVFYCYEDYHTILASTIIKEILSKLICNTEKEAQFLSECERHTFLELKKLYQELARRNISKTLLRKDKKMKLLFFTKDDH